MNQSDAERIRNVLESMSYTSTEKEEEADILGVVACSVRQKAIDRVYAKISLWNKWKKDRNILTFVSGCILPADKIKFLKRFDFLFSIDELMKLPELIRGCGVPTPQSINPHTSAPAFWNIQAKYSSSFEAYVPIQNGCDKFCSFCAVPYTRGREISRPSTLILEEIAHLVSKNYKSITLLGQNVNSYGLDKRSQEIGFPELLKRIGELGIRLQKKFWVYFTSPHPRDMTKEVIEIVANYPVLAKNIHLPLQSGDDKVLIRMNRNHRLSQYRNIVENIRELIPNATLFTDIIVGFSGETEAQFLNTAKAVEEFRYNMAFISQYSPRPGAASYRWKDDIPSEEKKRRFRHLSDILSRIALAQNEISMEKEYEVLVSGVSRKSGYLDGRTEGKISVQFPSDNTELIGSFQRVRVRNVHPFSLAVELVS